MFKQNHCSQNKQIKLNSWANQLFDELQNLKLLHNKSLPNIEQ